MKATMHNGRVSGAKHNDRAFKNDKDFHDDGHIDFEKTKDNVTWQLYPNMTFEENEKLFYKQNFSDALEEVNAGYIRNRHPERCKTMDDWHESARTCPEESIMQIGNMDKHGSFEDLKECVNDYYAWFRERTHGSCQILDMAIHVDEATPHLQMRRVWYYTDNGVKKIGQEKALEKLGYELPNPEAKKSRFNNRKMTFDSEAREKWYDICEEHGYEIDREPVKGRKHLSTRDNIIREQTEKIETNSKTLEQINECIDIQKDYLDEVTDLCNEKGQMLEELTEKCDKQEERLNDLNEKIGIQDDYLQTVTDLCNERSDTLCDLDAEIEEKRDVLDSIKDLVAEYENRLKNGFEDVTRLLANAREKVTDLNVQVRSAMDYLSVAQRDRLSEQYTAISRKTASAERSVSEVKEKAAKQKFSLDEFKQKMEQKRHSKEWQARSMGDERERRNDELER